MSHPDNYQTHHDYHAKLNSLLLTSTSQTKTDGLPSDQDFAASVHLIDSILVLNEDNDNSLADNTNLSIKDTPLSDLEMIIYDELSTPNGTMVTLPIYLEGKQYDALIDSGATWSFIDWSVVKQTNLLNPTSSGQHLPQP